jgi:hypothetical protein
MDTSTLKKFASFARTSLIEQVVTRLKAVLAEQSLARRENAAAVAELEKKIKELGKERVIEMVAYTWFNRFCALRFMDVNQYTTIGTVSPAEGFTQPEILTEAKQGVIDEELKVDRAKIIGLLDGTRPSQDAQGEVYQQLLIAVCNSYHKLMPFMFEKIADYTELLIPEDLLSDSSVLTETRKALTVENCADVEVIGWLYQFYISEKKDDVFAALKKGKKITPESIPAATQLFTPHWIVRYLVENSLGRLWMLNHPDSTLVERMDYYIKPEEPETNFLKISSPEEIKVCDPACGSGHMLTHAFDLLYAIYEEQGYNPTEIPRLILAHNLYGIEIDARAGALAAFALTMKAREKDRRFFSRSPIADSNSQPIENPESTIQNPNICVLKNIEIERDGFDNYLHSADRTSGLLNFCERATPIVFGQVDDASGCLPTPTQILEHCNYTKQAMQFADMLIASGNFFNVQTRKMLRRNKTLRKKLFLALRAGRPLLECSDPIVTEHFRREFRKVAFSGELLQYHKTIDLTGLVSDFYFELFNQYREADNFGSLIRPLVTDVTRVLELLRERKMDNDLFLLGVHQNVLAALRQADFLSFKYHVVVANPPYMGPKQMNPVLKDFGSEHYQDSKTDLYAMFLEKSFYMLRERGISAFVTMHSWMFLSSFTKLREKLLASQSLLQLAHLGARAFGSISGEIVAVAAFCFEKTLPRPRKSIYFRLLDGEEEQKDRQLRAREGKFVLDDQTSFKSVPDSPISYWVHEKTRRLFAGQRIEQLSISDGQNITADNERFVREFWEVNNSAVGQERHWLPYAKGGPFRRWYGNIENVVDWSESARAHYRAHASARIVPEYLWYRQGITWSRVGTALFGFRLLPSGTTFDKVGSSIFVRGDDTQLNLLLGILNTTVAQSMLEMLNPSVDLQVKDVRNIPIAENLDSNAISTIVQKAIGLSKKDWDSLEISLAYEVCPILTKQNKSLQNATSMLREEQRCMVEELEGCEVDLNQQIAAAYGFAKPAISRNDVSLYCNPHYRYGSAKSDSELEALLVSDIMREFISYAVGCMFGRYSLDKPGLILANQGETLEDYFRKLYRETTRTNPQLAIKDPKQVVFLGDMNVHCFGCNRVFPAEQAIFAVDAAFEDSETIKTTALLYCDDCFKGHKPGHLIHSQKLVHFSIQKALSRNWCDADSLEKFLEKANCFVHPVPLKPDEVTLLPDEDNVIPLLDGNWFNDDVTERFKAFLKVTFGTEHYEENLKFLEDALYPDNLTAKKRKTIRDYFLKDFYNHHIKLYKKRPIYWLFSSPKGTFNALIYMHRYRPDTVGTVLHYLRDFRDKLTHHAEHQQMLADTASASKSEKTQAIKDVAAIKKQLKELEDYEKTLFEVAARKIDIDLDDGVKHNHQLFGSVLRKIPGLDAKED